jgi:tetratricopeptide (TPR) repeat protein
VHAIDGLLGQANNADLDGNDAHALAFLAQADRLIRQAHLDQSPIRARWLLLRGEALMDDAANSDAARTSLENAVALFKTAAPRDSRYPDALIDLGSLSLDRSELAQSAGYYRQAIAIAQPDPDLKGDLLASYAGLALALQRMGDFQGAAAAFEHGTETAAHTYGRHTRPYWVIASDWAQFRYARGDRAAALGAFETLVQSLPDTRAAFRNASDAMEAAQVLRKYGYCLAIDGQSARSLQFLERAQGLLASSAAYALDVGRLQLDLGTAYAAAGRVAAARAAFSTALTDWRTQQAPPPKLEMAFERWGRFLFSQKDLNGAETAFNEVLRLADGHIHESVVAAQAGLAVIAASRNDVRTALQASGLAMEQLDHIEGYYDVRIAPYVWVIRARTLLLAGDDDAAHALARRAHDAALLYYAAGSAESAEADRLVRASVSQAARR